MFKYLDPYTLRARFCPAIIAAAPAFAAIALLISWTSLTFSNSIATIGLVALLFALADLARRIGKKIESQLFADMGGMPTATMLRHDSTGEFDIVLRTRYRDFLGGKLGETPPTQADETANSDAADAFYDRCAGWLRENTRNTRKFSLLFNENVTYGFRRNLLGLKRTALILNVLVVLICLFLLNRGTALLQRDTLTNDRIFVVLVVAVLHAVYFVFAVSKTAVAEAARVYSRQLIYSCESFLGKRPPISSKKKNSRKPSVAGSPQGAS